MFGFQVIDSKTRKEMIAKQKEEAEANEEGSLPACLLGRTSNVSQRSIKPKKVVENKKR